MRSPRTRRRTQNKRVIQSAAVAEKLAGAKIKRVVTVHDGYSYP